MMFKKRVLILSILVIGCSLLAGCAAGANVLKNSPASSGAVAGFGLGLWHGVILPISFIVSLFRDGVNVYEVHNNGAWYNFGFLMGAIMFWGGCSSGAARR